MKVDESVTLAELLDIAFRLVISRQNLHRPGAALHRLGHFVETAGPAHQVSGSEIVVGLDIHQLFKSTDVIVEVGKD
jgi:hypothetical protein